MRYLIPAMALLLAACASDGQAPVVPSIPAPPQLDVQSCENLKRNIAVIEAGKLASGHYGDGEVERLQQLRILAVAMGCLLDEPVPAEAPAEPVVIEPLPEPVAE